MKFQLPPSAVLDALSERDRQELLARAVPRALVPGQVLHLAGAPPTRLHLVLVGLIKLVGRDGEGRESILGLAVPGRFVGEVAALDGGPQPVDAVAVTRCLVLGLDAAALRTALGCSPIASFALTRELTATVRSTYELSLERASGEAASRLAGRLLHLADLMGRHHGETIELELPLGQRDLGRLAGICRESTCKILRHFRRQGVVDYDRRRLTILKPEMLRRIRCAGHAAAPYR